MPSFRLVVRPLCRRSARPWVKLFAVFSPDFFSGFSSGQAWSRCSFAPSVRLKEILFTRYFQQLRNQISRGGPWIRSSTSLEAGFTRETHSLKPVCLRTYMLHGVPFSTAGTYPDIKSLEFMLACASGARIRTISCDALAPSTSIGCTALARTDAFCLSLFFFLLC